MRFPFRLQAVLNHISWPYCEHPRHEQGAERGHQKLKFSRHRNPISSSVDLDLSGPKVRKLRSEKGHVSLFPVNKRRCVLCEVEFPEEKLSTLPASLLASSSCSSSRRSDCSSCVLLICRRLYSLFKAIASAMRKEAGAEKSHVASAKTIVYGMPVPSNVSKGLQDTRMLDGLPCFAQKP